jgi:ribose-phosphate pyrophosphokinase
MDLHSPQIQGFFHIPVDNLYALPVLCDHLWQKRLENMIVVTPDIGFTKQARKYAAYLGTPVAIANKERTGHDEHAEILEIIGDVRGKTAIVVDDFTISGGTLTEASTRLIELGAEQVYAMVSHGVLTEGSVERIEASPLKKLIITDTVENQPVQLSDKIEVISVAPVFGEAIRRIHYRESISAMFPK